VDSQWTCENSSGITHDELWGGNEVYLTKSEAISSGMCRITDRREQRKGREKDKGVEGSFSDRLEKIAVTESLVMHL